MLNTNNSNIYKLIKRAKDDKCISDDPLKRIITNPIKFVYSFTLNTKNEPYSEEILKLQESQNISKESINIETKSIKNEKNKEDKKINNNIKEKNDIKDKTNIAKNDKNEKNISQSKINIKAKDEDNSNLKEDNDINFGYNME